MCTELPDDVEWFLASLVAFAKARDDVRAVALVGSHARGVARPDSDVDVVLLSTEPATYIDGCDWIERFPGATLLATRRWGALTERRLVLANETEVDLGVACPSWASTRPLDPGTARVAKDGLIALHDPDGLLAEVMAAANEAYDAGAAAPYRLAPDSRRRAAARRRRLWIAREAALSPPAGWLSLVPQCERGACPHSRVSS